MEISAEFRDLYSSYKKKYKNQMSFRSLRMVKNSAGVKEPVFYVGVPGVMVAFAMVFIAILTVYILYLPFMWFVWVPYVVFVFFTFRIAMKLDKARQIRYMVYYLFEMSIKHMEKDTEEKDPDKKQTHRKLALEWLERAEKWVDEPELKTQIEILRTS